MEAPEILSKEDSVCDARSETSNISSDSGLLYEEVSDDKLKEILGCDYSASYFASKITYLTDAHYDAPKDSINLTK